MKALKIRAIPIYVGKGKWVWLDNTGSLEEHASWLREAADREIRELITRLRAEVAESAGHSACDLCPFTKRCAKKL